MFAARQISDKNLVNFVSCRTFRNLVYMVYHGIFSYNFVIVYTDFSQKSGMFAA